MWDRISCANVAVRCNNLKALRAIVDDDASVLFHGVNDRGGDSDGGEGTTLLHLVCENYGWNDEISFILGEIIKHGNPCGTRDSSSIHNNNNNQNHAGLFQETDGLEMPLKLSLETGSDLTEILTHVREEHPSYFEANLDRVSKIVAEYCYDMELFSDLIGCYGILLLDGFHPDDGSSPLNVACCYHNQDMIVVLLEEYFRNYREQDGLDIYGALRCVQKRLLSLNSEGMSPLGHLLLSVGDLDAQNVWSCIGSCTRFFAEHQNNNDDTEDDEHEYTILQWQQRRFPILHLFLLHAWDEFVAKKNCVRILDRIVRHLGIDVCVVDEETGRTVLSIAIEKMALHRRGDKTTNSSSTGNHKKKSCKVSPKILGYFLKKNNPVAVATADPASTTTSRTPANTKDGSGRLPLHTACEHSLPWTTGLEHVVAANMPALESNDPVTGLPPFAHCAMGAETDLDSIYELLRLHPGSIDNHGGVIRPLYYC